MANQRQDGAKERFWRRVLARQAAGRLSVRAFRRREQLSEPSFYGWRRTIDARDAQAKSKSGRDGSPTGRRGRLVAHQNRAATGPGTHLPPPRPTEKAPHTNRPTPTRRKLIPVQFISSWIALDAWSSCSPI
jgi:hypothetical protein